MPVAIYYADLLAQRGRIHASPIIGSVLGMDLIGDNSDTASTVSGGTRGPANLTQTILDEALRKANDHMKRYTDLVKPMFYC